VKSVGEIFKFLSTATFSRAQIGNEGNIQYLHYGDIHTKYNEFVDFSKTSLPKVLKKNTLHYALLQEGDVIMADASEDYVGLCKSVEIKNLENQKAISGLHTILLREKGSIYKNGFKGFIFLIPEVRRQLCELATGMKVFGVSKKNLISVLLPVPTLAEQTAIATALSDIDALITALDKKIAKKKLIKQGAMQQLLTGKKRLQGFKDKWVEKTLGETLHIKHGKSQLGISDNNGMYPILGTGGIIGYTNQYLYDKPSILIGRKGTIDKPQYFDTPFWTIDTLFYSLVYEFYNAKFLYYKFCCIDWYSYNEASGVPSLNAKTIENILISLPPTLEEQTAIATILSDMDSEITALEAKRDKYKQVKAGMMQQLLTGQIRLVNTSSQSQNLSENRIIPIAAHIVGGHIVNKLYGSKGWGRTKLQKSMHLVGYCCQLDFGSEYIRNVAGPDDQLLMNHIDSKFRQYRHVRIEVKNDGRGGKHYNYIPTSKITEIEQAFSRYPTEIQEAINNLLNKIKKMDLARAEIVSTLYAVWNNRIIKRQPINDDVLLRDFYDWSAHKSDFKQDLVLRGLNYMRQEDITPTGWGKYIDKK
jgi:type I restriction enzyme S subunit